MKRSAGVTAAAIVMLIGSALALLLCPAIVASVVMLSSHVWTRLHSGPTFRFQAATVLFRLGTLLFTGIMGLLSAIGLLRLRNWARIATIAFAIILVFLVIPALLLLLLVPPYMPGANAGLMHIYRAILIGPTAVSILVALWWLPYFTSASVKAQFQFLPERRWNPALDGVRAVAWLMLVVGAFTLAWPVGRMPGIYFLFQFKGDTTSNLIGLQSLWTVVAAIALLTLRRWAIEAASAAQVWGLVNGAFDIIRQIHQQGETGISWVRPSYHINGIGIAAWWTFAMDLVACGVFLWILIKRRRSFLAACDAADLTTTREVSISS